MSEEDICCFVCNQPVELKTSMTDGQGRAVHEECYLQWLIENADKRTVIEL
jgi:hypothetical protein